MQTLKHSGFDPRTILDLGAYRGNWSREIQQIFPEAKFFLVEGNVDCVPYLESSGFPYEISMLSDQKKTAQYYKHNGDDNTGNSLYIEQTQAYSEQNSRSIEVQCDTLANVVARNNLENIDFVKLDVQGSERDVMNGGLEVIKSAKVVLLELQLVEYNKGAPMIAEMIQYMDNIGFQLFDVTELHYTPGHVLLQIDVLFGREDVTDTEHDYT